MQVGGIIFVEIPVRDLARAADFYTELFGWSFEPDKDMQSWYFTSGSGGPMGRITTRRPAGGSGVLFFVAVDDIRETTSRAIRLGGGTSEATTMVAPDVGEYGVLIDPDGTRVGIFHGRLRGRVARAARPGSQHLGGG